MKIAIAGSFDPMTNGHVWLIQEAFKMTNDAVVFVADNPNKKYWFTPEERVGFIENEFSSYGVKVVYIKNQYAAVEAERYGVDYFLRGIRDAQDFESENMLQQVNRDVVGNIKTLFVIPPRDMTSVSSSFVKSLIGPPAWNFHINKLLPKSVYFGVLIHWFKSEVLKRAPFLNGVIEQIIDKYQNGRRYYHNLEHIVHCLSEFNTLPEEEKTLELFLALIFHDVVYDPFAKNNEELSVDFFNVLITDADVNRQKVGELILATKNHFAFSNTEDIETSNMLSIDLSVLGQSANVYNIYKGNIAKEYGISKDFVEKRLLFLNKATKSILYPAKMFAERYGSSAFYNLNGEILYWESFYETRN